jgi:hypothetical protein
VISSKPKAPVVTEANPPNEDISLPPVENNVP